MNEFSSIRSPYALLQGGTYNYFSLFKNKIAPFLQEALLQKKENEEAEKTRRKPKQLADFPTHHETVTQALKDPFTNFKMTLIIRPLKRRFSPEVPLPGPPAKKTITQTEPVQKIHLQNVDQSPQELPIPPIAPTWAEEVETDGAVAKEAAASDEVQPVSGASVSGESGEATSDKGSQSAPEPPPKKRLRRRTAPADKQRQLKHAQEFREKEAQQTAFSAEFLEGWRERHKQEEVQKVSAVDTRCQIVYQFGRRTTIPTERKAYRKIPLVTEDDQ